MAVDLDLGDHAEVMRRVVAPVLAALYRHGDGAVVPVPLAWRDGAPAVAATILKGATSLVVLSAGYPAADNIVLRAFRPGCEPAPMFGDRGAEQLTFPGGTVNIATAIPSGDGALLAGQTAHGWLVARIDAAGALDPSFGVGGWSALPWAGGASALAETPSGRILVGGSEGSGCCVRAWVAELTSSGRIVDGFGRHGRSEVPIGVGPDSGVSSVVPGDNGSTFVLNAGGNMGCWGVSVSKLSATGLLVPSFQSHFSAALRRVAPAGVFVGTWSLTTGASLSSGRANPSVCHLTPQIRMPTGSLLRSPPTANLTPVSEAEAKARSAPRCRRRRLLFHNVTERPCW